MFEEFIKSDNDKVRDMAENLERYKTAHKDGQITNEELQELSDDLLDLDKIDDLADKLEERVVIKEAMETMITIIKGVTGLI